MASSESQRQTVVPEISATRPRSIASRATSAALQRRRGTPKVAGSSQANALTSILASGGKEGRSAGAGPVLQSIQSLLVKALAPLTRRLGSGVQPGGDFLVGGSLGGQQHDPGAHHLPVGSGVSSGSLLQDGVLIFGGFDAEWTLAGHVSSPFSAMRHPPRPYRERRTHQRNSVKEHLVPSMLSMPWLLDPTRYRQVKR